MKLKPCISYALVLLIFVFISGCNNPTVELFVSPEGSDDGSGSMEQPYASLERARAEVRRLNKEGLKSDVIVYLREGSYFLDVTFILGPEDSAPEGHTITYSSYKDEQVILHSGVNIRSWARTTDEIKGLPPSAAGNIWEADIPAGMGRFFTLYEGNMRLPRAQTKGFIPDAEHPDEENRWGYDHFTLRYPGNEIRDWENLEDVELICIPSYPWSMNILRIESVDEDHNTVRTSIPATYPMRRMPGWISDAPEFSETCWAENVPEGLDSPGEWMINTVKGKVYLWPEGSRPGSQIFAPCLRELVLVQGKNDEWGDEDVPVRGIIFRGINFTLADRGVWNKDDKGIQHDWEMLDKDNAMLRFRGAEECRVDACRFYNAGGNGIRMDLYARHIHVENCLFHNLGQSAVMMIGYGPGTKDVNNHNRIYNNYIHHCGEIYWHSQMITAWQSGDNYIGHNYLHNIPRKAVCISGVRTSFLTPEKKNLRECGQTIRWEEIGEASTWDEFQPFLHARNNLVEYNEVHDALEMLGDGAVINLSGGGVDNIIRNNYVHHIHTSNASACIRMDGYQRNTLVENNVVFHAGIAGISPKGENAIRNNYVVDVCRKKNMGCIRGFARTQGISDFVHNIVYNPYEDKEMLAYNAIDDYSNEVFGTKTIDHNLWYNPYREFEENAWLVKLKSKGVSHHSIYMDPLFRDWENGDFTLESNSPALEVGIRQIDLSEVGLTPEYPGKFRDPSGSD